MDDIKEKLVEIMRKKPFEFTEGSARYVADHLLANDVAIQKWISVEERLPTEQDADDVGAVLAVHKAARKRYYHWRSVVDNPFDFAFWMPIPQPPKGE